jgi:ComF family protein
MKVFEELLDLFLPSSCVLCLKKGSPLCSACQNLFAGPALEVKRSNFNGYSLNGVAVSLYSKPAAAMVHELKENSQTFLATAMAKPMAKALAVALAKDNVSGSVTLVPMPSKKSSFQKRGFNQSQLLAKIVSSQFRNHKKIRVDNCLKLNRKVLDQATQIGAARRENLFEAFSLVRSPQARDIWLVDDVVTTGATLLEAARCLSVAGFKVRGFLVFAETLPKNQQKVTAGAS